MIQYLLSFVLVMFSGSQYQQPHSPTGPIAPTRLLATNKIPCHASRLSAAATVMSLHSNMMQEKSILLIMTDSVLWGKDFTIVLAYLESLERVKEQKIAVFTNKAVSGTPFKLQTEAQQLVERLNKSVTELQSNPTPLFNAMIKRAHEPLAKVSAEVIPYFAEDKSVRVALTSPKFQLLASDLTVATVEKQLGKPEKITTELIDTEGEERPIILTLYSYAEGSVTFAEADIAPRPGFINRVIIDVPAVTAALTKEIR